MQTEFLENFLSVILGTALSASDCYLVSESAGILLTVSTIFRTNSKAYFASAKTGSFSLHSVLAAS
jgi:hypothetical protein